MSSKNGANQSERLGDSELYPFRQGSKNHLITPKLITFGFLVSALLTLPDFLSLNSLSLSFWDHGELFVFYFLLAKFIIESSNLKEISLVFLIYTWIELPWLFLPAVQETWVQSLGWEDSLLQGMATHSSSLVWRIPMDKGPAGYRPWGHKELDMTE